jgi:hypothetical protein
MYWKLEVHRHQNLRVHNRSSSEQAGAQASVLVGTFPCHHSPTMMDILAQRAAAVVVSVSLSLASSPMPRMSFAALRRHHPLLVSVVLKMFQSHWP